MHSFADLSNFIRLDLTANKGLKFKTLVILFRLANFYYQSNIWYKYIFILVIPIYRVYSEFLIGAELPPQACIGKGLGIRHGFGIVVHRKAIIGNYCILRQGVTIGNKGDHEPNGVPTIGNNVEFGANATVVGAILIGNNVLIGTGVVIAKSLSDNARALGVQPKIISRGE